MHRSLARLYWIAFWRFQCLFKHLSLLSFPFIHQLSKEFGFHHALVIFLDSITYFYVFRIWLLAIQVFHATILAAHSSHFSEFPFRWFEPSDHFTQIPGWSKRWRMRWKKICWIQIHCTDVGFVLTMALLNCAVVCRAVFGSFAEFGFLDQLKLSVCRGAQFADHFPQSHLNQNHD
jgi:hypothetical protein